MVAAFTMNYVEEAIGVVAAAQASLMAVAISFTVETDGRLPSGQSLEDAIVQTDAQTHGYAAYYMINCAHPNHFSDALERGGSWLERLRGLRANASTRSHAELDDSTTLWCARRKEIVKTWRSVQRSHVLCSADRPPGANEAKNIFSRKNCQGSLTAHTRTRKIARIHFWPRASPMATTQWYELRLAIPPGIAGGDHQRVALSASGRLCSVNSGGAKKFDSVQDAMDFLGQTTITQLYNFEAVLCTAVPSARSKRSPPPDSKRASG